MADQTQAINLQALIDRGIQGLPQFQDGLVAWWEQMRTLGGMDPAIAALLALFLLAAVYSVERGLRIVVAHSRIGAPKSEQRERVTRWAFGRFLSLLVFAMLADMVFAFASEEGSTLRFMGGLLTAGVLRARIFFSLVELLGKIYDSSQSEDAGDGGMAQALARKIWLPISITLAIFLLRTLLIIAIGPEDSLILVGFVLTVGVSLCTAWIYFSFRSEGTTFATALLVDAPENSRGFLFVARYWHWFYSGFIILSDLITFADEMGLTGTRQEMPVIGLTLLLLPSLIAATRLWQKSRSKETKGKSRAIVAGTASLVEGLLVVTAAAYVSLSWSQWSTDDASASDLERITNSVLVALLTFVIGNAVWRALSAFLDIYAPAQTDSSQPMAEEGGGQAGGRLATVYPVLRGAVFFTVYAITVMIALTSLGVEIGPLLAGAGVVGFAIGFGAQAIVKDIISGIFYLMEDAFRLGEYIETDAGKGVVEKISLRSVRLRHHRGPVFTIPFGSMGPIQNHSRDWVKIKFTVEVRANEDLEKLRKLIKKIGVSLMEDPDIGENFLEPLKSQGVIGMSGPNYIIGIKFSCRPGEQFVIRRKAYVALQKAFAENGIVTAQPKIVVESALPVEVAGAAGSKALAGQPTTG